MTTAARVFAAPVPKPARRLPPEVIAQRFDAAKDLRARVGRLGAGLSAKLASIDSRFGVDARRDEQRRLRDGFQEDVTAAGVKLAEILADLNGQIDHYTPEAARVRALHGDKYDDAASAHLGTYWLARLAAAPTWELVELARIAASTDDLALALRVEAEASRRVGESGADDALGLCACVSIPPQDRDVAGKIDSGITTCEMALTEIQEMVTGASRTERKLDIAFAANARSRALNPKGRPGAVDAVTKAEAEKQWTTFSAKSEKFPSE